MDQNQYQVHQAHQAHQALQLRLHLEAHHPMMIMMKMMMRVHLHHLTVVQVLQHQVHHQVLVHHLANVKVQM